MKLYVSPRAPNPRRVEMFIVEKNIPNIALVSLNLAQQEHKEATYRAISPMAQVPALELPDGRVLTVDVLQDGAVHASFENMAQARRWVQKLGLVAPIAA